jgi:Transposase
MVGRTAHGVARSVRGPGGRSRECPAILSWLPNEAAARWVLAAAWFERGESIQPSSGLSAVASPQQAANEENHRVCHRDQPPQGVAHCRRPRRRRTAYWGAARRRRPWPTGPVAAVRGTVHTTQVAIEAAGGLGALLAQQLVAVGETVLDVAPTLSARVRLLDVGRTDKTDRHDARSAAIVALRHSRLRTVTAARTPRADPAVRLGRAYGSEGSRRAQSAPNETESPGHSRAPSRRRRLPTCLRDASGRPGTGRPLKVTCCSRTRQALSRAPLTLGDDHQRHSSLAAR